MRYTVRRNPATGRNPAMTSPALDSLPVHEAVRAYLGDGSGDLPLAVVRDDIARIVQQHPTVESVAVTPRGHDGACSMDIHGHDGDQIALVVVYADGQAEALPVPSEIATRWARTAPSEWTPADWHHYVRAAPNIAEAGDRMQAAADADVDFTAMMVAADSSR